MIQSPEILHGKMAAASKASVALEIARSILTKKHDDTLKLLKSIYRSGEFDSVKMAGLIGQMVALDDVIQGMENTINLGERAAKELNNVP